MVSSLGDSLSCLTWLKSYTFEFDDGAECHLTEVTAGRTVLWTIFCGLGTCENARDVMDLRHCWHTLALSAAVAADRAKAIL